MSKKRLFSLGVLVILFFLGTMLVLQWDNLFNGGADEIAEEILSPETEFDPVADEKIQLPGELDEFSRAFDAANMPDEFLDAMSGSQYVLLGESSHGTKEYYIIRDLITRELVSQHGFSYVAVEGDWPNLYYANLYVKGITESAPVSAEEVLIKAARWPEWMWANTSFLALVEWLREYNSNLPAEERVGLYGIDMQDMSGSINATLNNLNKFDSNLAQRVAEKYDCIKPYSDDLMLYAEAHALEDVDCSWKVRLALNAFMQQYPREEILLSPELLNIKQNMLAVKSAEIYSRAVVFGGPLSWNIRSQFMKETVENLTDFYGEGAKGIIWAHNTHVGDARATDMTEAGKVNIGQLLREEHGEERVYIVGLGSDRGTVKAGRDWGTRGEIMNLPPAPEGTFENLLSRTGKESLILLMHDDNIPSILKETIGNRAKGVVYNPGEDSAYYVPTIPSQRYDAFIFINETSALKAL